MEFQDQSGWVTKMGKRLVSWMKISGWSRVVAEKRNGGKVREGGRNCRFTREGRRSGMWMVEEEDEAGVGDGEEISQGEDGRS